MTDQDKITKLRKGIMCAVIHLWQTHPEDIVAMFTMDEITEISNETADLQDIVLEGFYKDLLDITKPKE